MGGSCLLVLSFCFFAVFCLFFVACLLLLLLLFYFVSFCFKSIKTKRLRPQWIFSFAYFLHAGDDCGR